MLYLLITIAVLSLGLGIYANSQINRKSRNKKLIERLRKTITSDNAQLQRIYDSDDFLNKNLSLKYIGKRLIAHGIFQDATVVVKVKESKLLIGILTPSTIKDAYFDLRVDTATLEETDTVPRFYGAESNYFYVLLDETWSREIKDHIFEVLEIWSKQQTKRTSKTGMAPSIMEYEKSVLVSNERYR